MRSLRAMMMVAGAVAVHAAVTACSGGESTANAGGSGAGQLEVVTVQCGKDAYVTTPMPDMTATEIAFGVRAFGRYDTTSGIGGFPPDMVGETVPVIAANGRAGAWCRVEGLYGTVRLTSIDFAR